MASFIIHTIVGEHLLKRIEDTYNIEISENDKKQFLLGNLIVDSINTSKEIPSNIKDKTQYKMEIKNKIRKEKLTTHFRDESKEGECLKVPVPESFLNKYQRLIKDNLSVLGYLFHLYTDKIFFSVLFRETFDSLDKEGNPTNYDKTLENIKIKKNGILVDAKEFWAGTSNINIYNDYTIINKILLEYYGTSFDILEYLEYAKVNFINPGIEEVSYSNIPKILKEMEQFINESYTHQGGELQVFSYDQIIDFIEYVVNNFLTEYKDLLEKITEEKGLKHDFRK